MCWFCGKPKTAMDLMLDEQRFWRNRLKGGIGTYEAEKKLTEINELIMGAAKLEINKALETRLKSIEDAISDLYLVGKSDVN